MWQLFFYLIGLVLCFAEHEIALETFAGNDVTFHCNVTSKIDRIIHISLLRSDDTTYFQCGIYTVPCNTTDMSITQHSLKGNDTFNYTVTIRNVLLRDEGEYDFKILAPDNSETCNINLTVKVSPTGLILIDKHREHGDEVLQDNGLLRVEGGENKTIVCKTNTPIKPAVNLTWVIPKGLNVISDYGEQIQDEQDERLFVPTWTLSFTLNYTFNDDISLVCKVASIESFEPIQTLINIRNKGETKTNTEISWTSSTAHQTFARSDGSEVLNATMTTNVTFQTEDGMEQLPWLQESWAVIAGSSSGVILLLVFATAVCIIRKKKVAVRGLGKLDSTRDATQSRLFQSRGSLPPPPSDQSSLTANHLPDRQPSPARSFRPAPPIPPDIPMRQMVPVSDDTNGTTSENNRLRGATSRGASASSPATHSQRGLDTDMEYDVLNDTEYDVLNMEYAVVNKTPSKATGAVPHVYREATNGLAEYALVSRPKMGKNALQPRFRSTEQQDDEFEYAVVDKSHRTGRESVPHVYTQTMSGLEEYAVVNKPKDRKKRQSEVRHTTAPGDFEAEYAVVDKWQKN